MKIGIYTGEIPAPVFIENMVIGLADVGYQVYLYGDSKERPAKFNYSGIILRLHPVSGKGKILISIYYLFLIFWQYQFSGISILKMIYGNSGSMKQFIYRVCRVLPPFLDKLDLFHIQWAKTLVFYPEFIKKLDCPVLLSFRGAHINYSPLVDKKLADGYKQYFPKVAGFHAVSAAISLEAQKYGADPKKITIIPPAIKKDLIHKSIVERSTNKDDELKIISVGRCHWKKGYTLALDAMAILKEKGTNFQYAIIAGGKDDENLLYQIHDLGLAENVTFINGLPHEKVIEMVSNSTLFLLPSVEEGISNAVLEAMALGVPVLSTDCGGMDEVIDNGKNGFIVSARDPDSMAGAIRKFICLDEKNKITIINNAKGTIIHNHLLSHQITQFQYLYRKIVREL